MIFALSTHWNAARHVTGEALIEEILQLGLDHVELGYDLRADLVPGVQKLVGQKAVRVVSVHNFCPVPVGAPRGHPELFSFTSPDRREREGAVRHTRRTLQFAREVGARAVVVHAGRVDTGVRSDPLFALYARGETGGEAYGKLKLRLQVQREARARRHLEWLKEGLDQLVPDLQEAGLQLAFENLPGWDSVPTESEMESIGQHYGGRVGYWHDIGHGYVREAMGFINQQRWLERLRPYLVGMHVHDASAEASDHLMPPRGRVDWPALKPFAADPVLRVMEPSPQTPSTEIVEGVRYLQGVWAGETAAS